MTVKRVVKKRILPEKFISPKISQRDWREINGICLWMDEFEKTEYVMENNRMVQKYQSQQWKKFVKQMKMSIEKLQHVTKIHMPVPLPTSIIDIIEGNK